MQFDRFCNVFSHPTHVSKFPYPIAMNVTHLCHFYMPFIPSMSAIYRKWVILLSGTYGHGTGLWNQGKSKWRTSKDAALQEMLANSTKILEHTGRRNKQKNCKLWWKWREWGCKYSVVHLFTLHPSPTLHFSFKLFVDIYFLKLMSQQLLKFKNM